MAIYSLLCLYSSLAAVRSHSTKCVRALINRYVFIEQWTDICWHSGSFLAWQLACHRGSNRMSVPARLFSYRDIPHTIGNGNCCKIWSSTTNAMFSYEECTIKLCLRSWTTQYWGSSTVVTTTVVFTMSCICSSIYEVTIDCESGVCPCLWSMWS